MLFKISADDKIVSSWDMGLDLEKCGENVIFMGKVYPVSESYWVYDSETEKTSFRLSERDESYCWFDGDSLSNHDLKNWKVFL